MPRADFVRDLAHAATLEFDRLTCVVPEDDGQFSFSFQSDEQSEPIRIDVCIEDISLYPSRHRYLVFAGDNAPISIATKLQTVNFQLDRTNVAQLLTRLSSILTGDVSYAAEQITEDINYAKTASKDSGDEASDELEYNYDVDQDDEMHDIEDSGSQQNDQDQRSFDANIRHDLSLVKAAGFKMGYYGNLKSGVPCYISVSCRIAKLGISEEALKAWFVSPSNYLILLLYYPEGYRNLEKLVSSTRPENDVEFRVGVGVSYKPKSRDDAHAAFRRNDHVSCSTGGESQKDDQNLSSFRSCLLSKPLNSLLKDRLMQFLKYRLNQRISWAGAELYYEDHKEDSIPTPTIVDEKYGITDPAPPSFPNLVRDDNLHLDEPVATLSFPLLAIQFVLRHFVRCTDFCLVCHRRLIGPTEAIRPYVCERPLCLFQYMSLDLGPAIEHEIVEQPYVVDLLVSFCYASAAGGQLKDLPIGLGLKVPIVDRYAVGYFTREGRSKVYSGVVSEDLRTVLIDLTAKTPHGSIYAGEWIVISHVKDVDYTWHCRIKDDSKMPLLQISELKLVPLPVTSEYMGKQPDQTLLSGQRVIVQKYDNAFDERSRINMMATICFLLDTLPTVGDMVQWLQNQPGRSLRDWKDVICPAALGVLRWILASNRSCIMQIGKVGLAEDETNEQISQDHVAGNPGWMQFKFATGAPDKEQRFVQELRMVTSELSLRYPSRFAWHGSSLHNWHGIIREGLNYDKVVHGRAQGNGVYLSPFFNTSTAYLTDAHSREPSVQSSKVWRSSILKVVSAIALAELVNAPSLYVSASPHFVLTQLDWIQTRYLFVKTSGILIGDTFHQLKTHIEQDPDRRPCGFSGRSIVLPLSAIPSTRRMMMYQTAQPKQAKKPSKKSGRGKRRKVEVVDLTVVDDKSDNESIKTLAEDLEPLNNPLAVTELTRAAQDAERQKRLPFDCDTLDTSKVPILDAPTYGNRTATMKLQKALQSLVTLQTQHKKNDTLYELGWYLDEEHVERTGHLYQWLVAIHSLELSLPLAQDMRRQKCDNILFEIRFHDSYPHSPPFIRVVRPRFLPFASGGGGHITSGGSVCMDLLTNTGWSAAYDMEAVLLEVRLALQNQEPQPARLTVTSRSSSQVSSSDYSMSEAVEAYERVCRAHGWAIPPTLRAIANANQQVAW